MTTPMSHIITKLSVVIDSFMPEERCQQLLDGISQAMSDLNALGPAGAREELAFLIDSQMSRHHEFTRGYQAYMHAQGIDCGLLRLCADSYDVGTVTSYCGGTTWWRAPKSMQCWQYYIPCMSPVQIREALSEGRPVFAKLYNQKGDN